MEQLYNSLFNGLVLSDDIKAILILFIFEFIICVTVQIIGYLRIFGGGR